MIADPLTVSVIGPAVSCVEEIGIMCSCDNNPTVGLKPTIPIIVDGHIMDPFVSVPIAAATIPEATAEPLPELDPQGERFST